MYFSIEILSYTVLSSFSHESSFLIYFATEYLQNKKQQVSVSKGVGTWLFLGRSVKDPRRPRKVKRLSHCTPGPWALSRPGPARRRTRESRTNTHAKDRPCVCAPVRALYRVCFKLLLSLFLLLCFFHPLASISRITRTIGRSGRSQHSQTVLQSKERRRAKKLKCRQRLLTSERRKIREVDPRTRERPRPERPKQKALASWSCNGSQHTDRRAHKRSRFCGAESARRALATSRTTTRNQRPRALSR